MTNNEKKLMAVLVGVVILSATGLNLASTWESGKNLSEEERSYKLSERYAAKLYAEIERLREERRQLELQKKSPGIKAAQAHSQDILEVGALIRKEMSKHTVSVVAYSVEQRNKKSFINFTVKGLPEQVLEGLKAICQPEYGLTLPRCDIKYHKEDRNVEASFSAGYKE